MKNLNKILLISGILLLLYYLYNYTKVLDKAKKAFGMGAMAKWNANPSPIKKEIIQFEDHEWVAQIKEKRVTDSLGMPTVNMVDKMALLTDGRVLQMQGPTNGIVPLQWKVLN